MVNAADSIKLSVSAPSIRFVVVEVPSTFDDVGEATVREIDRCEDTIACQAVRSAVNAWLYEQDAS